MDKHARYALLRQDFEHLLSIRDPASVNDWQPTEAQRLAYGQLLERVLNGIDAVQSFEKRQVLREGNTQSYVSDSSLAFYREQVEPRIAALRHAYETVDPDGACLYEFLEDLGAPSGAGGWVKATFEEGLQQIYQLIDRNPDLESTFLPDTAFEFMDSKLIGFDPDSWLDRAGALAPIRTDRKNMSLPIHVRLRLEELFRAYIFGCWLSVVALSRTVLEYAILDNLHKFDIDRYWPLQDKSGKRKEKRLEHLIDEVSSFLPTSLAESMDKLRIYGNDYLHPKKSEVSKAALLQRKQVAKDALDILIEVTEALYLVQKAKV